MPAIAAALRLSSVRLRSAPRSRWFHKADYKVLLPEEKRIIASTAEIVSAPLLTHRESILDSDSSENPASL